MKTLSTLLPGTVLLFSIITAAYGGTADVSIYTARIGGGGVEATSRFDCSDSIYVFIESDGPRDPRSTAEARWINPSGRIVRSGEHGFEAMDSGGQYAWDGIDIEAGGNAFANMLGAMFDPAAGYEDAIGEWRVDVRVDGSDFTSFRMEVLC